MTPFQKLQLRILEGHKTALARAIAKGDKRQIAEQTRLVKEVGAVVMGFTS